MGNYFKEQEAEARARIAEGYAKKLPAAVPNGIKTGGSASYYQVFVGNPTHLPAPYTAECNDLIESLKLTPAEANVVKAIWRQAVARMGGDYKVGADAIYDAEKSVFFSQRILSQAIYDKQNNPNPSEPQQS